MSLTQKQSNLLSSLRNAAKEQLENTALTDEELSALGASLSGLIGELSACMALDLQWCPSKGYDARKGGVRFQIKTRRRSVPEEIKKGRVGRFRSNDFDFAILVILDYDFEVKGVYKLPRDEVESLQSKERGNRGVHVAAFQKAAGEPIYPKNESSHKLERVKQQ